MKEIRYNCTENDNYIIAEIVDGKIDEILFGSPAGDGQIIYALSDVKRALRDFEREAKR